MRASVYLTDDSGRRRSYNATRLADEGWTSRVAVTATDHIAPGAGVSFRPVPLLGPISVWFTEDVNGITPSSVLVRRLIGYTVMLNPEFVLDVTDLAGNPFRREELYVQTAPPG